VGLTESLQTGGNVAQGMLGIQNFFKGSPHKVSYGDLRLEPMMFQDDLGRLCHTYYEAQSANDKIESVMNLKQLQVHVYKSSYLLLGSKKNVHDIRKFMEKNPLQLNGKALK